MPIALVVNCLLLILGYGVFAAQDHDRGSFLLDYAGVVLTAASGDALENKDYAYFFKVGGIS